MKRKMMVLNLMVFLLLLAVVCGGEKVKEMSVAKKAFHLRFDGKSQQAKDMLAEYLKVRPDDAAAQYEYSRVLFYLFDIEAAEKHAALAIQQELGNPKFHCWRGMCAMYLYIDQAHHKGNLDPLILKRAIDEFRKAIELEPDYHHARFLLVNMLNNNSPKQGGDKKQASEHTQYLMEKDLDYGLQATMIVKNTPILNDKNWKIRQYQKALTIEPNNAGLHIGISTLYARSGEIEKTQEHIDKALELDTQQKDVLLDVVFPLVKKKQYHLAIEMTERYLNLSADESAAMRSFALFYIAKIEKMSGNPDAEKTLKRSRQTDPDGWQTMMAPPAMLFEPIMLEN